MAQKVGYLDDNVIFEEGPFVMTCVHGSWRIEVEYVGHRCPALPDLSIYELLRAERGKQPGWGSDEAIAAYVDWLNEQVRLGRIVLHGLAWICPQYSVGANADAE